MDAMHSGSEIFRAAAAHKTHERERELPLKQEPKRVPISPTGSPTPLPNLATYLPAYLPRGRVLLLVDNHGSQKGLKFNKLKKKKTNHKTSISLKELELAVLSKFK
jgi:hypothetical protein